MTIHPPHEAAFWPLLQDTPIGDQLIAGTTLLLLQEENTSGIDEAHLIENAWVTRADWESLALAPAPAVLKSNCGNVLAWTGDHNPDIFTTEIDASNASFLIRYAWEFIQLNEDIVSRYNSQCIYGGIINGSSETSPR